MAKKTTLPATAPKLALTGESQPPDWSRARAILDGIRHALRISIGCQVMLGHELLTLKTELGFLGSGRRSEKGHDVAFKSMNRTWEQWCNSELGISDKTADRKIEMWEAAKLRVKKLGGQPKLVALLDTVPSKFTEEDHKLFAGMVDKLVDGDSQKSLLEELKIAKAHVALTGGDTSAHQKPKPATAEQLVFAMFSPLEDTITKAAKAAEKLRLGPDYKHLLNALPLVSDEPGKPSLTALKAQLEGVLKGDIAKTLEEIEAIIALRLKSAAA